MRHLVGPQGNVTVVGDEDQSIYSWRGADIQNILDFEHDFPGARVLRLEENYRSTQAILDAASALVAHNRARKGKTLRAVKAAGEPVRLHQAGDEFQEAAWVVEPDRRAAARGRAAVLFRMNAQSRLLEEALHAPRHPLRGGGRRRLLRAQGGQGPPRLPAPRPEPARPRRAAPRPQRARRAASARARWRRSSARPRSASISAWEALAAVDDEALLPARATLPLRRFRELIERLREEADGLGHQGPARAASWRSPATRRRWPRRTRRRARTGWRTWPSCSPPPPTTRRATRRRPWPASSTRSRCSPTPTRSATTPPSSS